MKKDPQGSSAVPGVPPPNAGNSQSGQPARAVLIAVGVLSAATVGVACFTASLAYAEAVVGSQALRAAASIEQATAEATAGNAIQAKQTILSAQERLRYSKQANNAIALKILKHFPGIGSVIDDTQHFLSAAGNLSDTALSGVELLGTAMGTAPGETPVFANGRIAIGQLGKLTPYVTQLDQSIGRAEDELSEVQGSAPFVGDQILGVRDQTVDRLTLYRRIAGAARTLLPDLPDSLGARRPRTYLIAVLNPAEQFPTGGAPLSVMVVKMDKGKLTVPYHGSVSTDVFPVTYPRKKNDPLPWLRWRHAAGRPFFGSPKEPELFVNSNFHPDFRISGVDMARAWESGRLSKGAAHPRLHTPVDGVVTIDMTAIAEVLRATGPLASPDFGEITGDNVGQRLLIDAYENVTDIPRRQAMNGALMSALISRLNSGTQSAQMANALLKSVPGRHVQVWMRDSELQAQVAAMGADGRVSSAAGDHVAVYSISGPTKLGVYVDRRLNHEVKLGADGSAEVNETITVTNGAPPVTDPNTPTTGYNARRFSSAYLFYLPAHARQAQVVRSGGVLIPVKAKRNIRRFGDGLGRQFLYAKGSADPGQELTFRVSYRLPAGTFLRPGGGLEYDLTVDPQPAYRPAALAVHVAVPDGYRAITSPAWTQAADIYSRGVTLDVPTRFRLQLR